MSYILPSQIFNWAQKKNAKKIKRKKHNKIQFGEILCPKKKFTATVYK